MKTIQIQLNECYAKTRNGQLAETVVEHGILTGLIAKQIVKIFNIDIHDSIPFIASIHDVGKISIIFQTKIKNKELYETAYALRDINLNFHYGLGCAFLKKIYNNKTISEAVGRHHGFSPENNSFRYNKNRIESERNTNYHEIRELFLNKMQEFFKPSELIVFDGVKNQILSGIITLSDWIASGLLFFLKDNIYDSNIDQVIYKQLSFLYKCDIKRDLTFSDIFNHYTPTQTQKEFYEKILNSDSGVFYIEEQAGNGKSEIALYAAYQLLNKVNDLRGIYFALPTQLTSNKMFERFQDFVNVISTEAKNVKLLHGNADIALYTMYNELNKNDEFIDNKNIELFNPFCVGTVDQILLSVLNSKFNFLKTFGLYKKIIVIDQIHSYDEYTATLIKYLIDNSKQLGCYVIALSATLPNSIKKLFCQKDINFNDNYPLLTTIIGNSIEEIQITPNVSKTKEYSFIIENDDNKAIQSIIQDANNGCQTLWVENSVKKSQYLYSKIVDLVKESNFNIQIGLLHSKYLDQDKMNIENYWINTYGKNSKNRYKCGRILISTQLVQQSIDIDCDVLYTRLAPMDMIIQRCGRCWRHCNNRPVNQAKVHLLSLNSQDVNNIKTENWFVDERQLQYSGLIYPKSILIKTLKYFEQKKTVSFPKDTRKMINYAYSENYFENNKIKSVMDQEKNNSQRKILMARDIQSNHFQTQIKNEIATRLIQDEQSVLIKSDSLILGDDFYQNKINIQKNTLTISKKNLLKHGISNNFEFNKYGINYMLELKDGVLYNNNTITSLSYNNILGLFV